jgi:hypothetical protein
MKRLVILAILATPAYAQQPQPDPRVQACQTLLGEATGRLLGVIGEAETKQQMLSKQLEEAKAELAKLKSSQDNK